MDVRDRAESASGDDRFTTRGREAADRARYTAISVVDLLEAGRASGDDFAVSLLRLLELVEHAKRENPGMRGSDLLPRGARRRRGGWSRCC